jgi:Bacteriophage holin family
MTETLPKWLAPLVLAALAWLAPIHALLGLVGLLISIDFVLGIAAAVKKGEAITSKAMSRTVYKALGYQLAVITGFALESLVPGGIPVAKLCASAIGLVEAKSICESVQVLTGLNLKGILAKAAEAGRQAPPPKE